MTRDERRALWAERVAAQRASGASAVAWCWQQGISEQAFYAWRKRLAAPSPTSAAGSPAAAATPQWVAVTPVSGTGVTVRVGAVSIEVAPGFDPRLLADVLAVLGAR